MAEHIMGPTAVDSKKTNLQNEHLTRPALYGIINKRVLNPRTLFISNKGAMQKLPHRKNLKI